MSFNDPSHLSPETPPEDTAPHAQAPEAVENQVANPILQSEPAAVSPNPTQPPQAANTLTGVVVETRPGPDENPKTSFGERPGWLALGLAVLLSIILSTALSLGVLAAANHGLLYASPAQVLALQAKLDTLQTRLDTQEQDLAGMRARLEAVEKLAGRTTTLEQAAQTLRSELEKRTADLETLRGVVSAAQKQIEQVVTQSSAFETFISGMRNLLANIPLPGVTKP